MHLQSSQVWRHEGASDLARFAGRQHDWESNSGPRFAAAAGAAGAAAVGRVANVANIGATLDSNMRSRRYTRMFIFDAIGKLGLGNWPR